MIRLFIDLLGWLGALFLLGAYLCISFKKLQGDSALYQLMNGIGGCFLVVNTMTTTLFLLRL